MYKYRRLIVSAIAVLLVLVLVAGLVVSVFAASSSEIKQQIESLQSKADSITQQQKELQEEISANESKQLDMVEQKSQLDKSIKLTQDEIDNKNEQIQEYNLLIAEKQNELDDALAQQEELNAQYKLRIRTMEETGKVSYWSVLFKANNFSDLLDRVYMIQEIAEADNKMLQQMKDLAEQIETDRESLAAEKVALEETKEELTATEESLNEQREEADSLLSKLNADTEELKAETEKYEAMEEELTQQIAKQEAAYQAALSEEAAAQAQQNNSSSGSSNSSSGSSGSSSSSSSSGSSSDSSSSGSSSSSGGFIWPTSTHKITCAYGYRIHPITGKYSFHTGIDIGASSGSPIYAAKSGTVTAATYNYVYGYYVTINHGDGYSSLYGHMTHYVVSSGQHVNQGQIIGYVGSTGYSTGPHLHFTVYKNGSTINPVSVLP